MKRMMIMLLTLTLASLTALAQQLSGKVMDVRGPLEGATVVELDKNDRVLNQTTTDANGIFLLSLKSYKNKVRVTKNGYRHITEEIDGRTMVRFTLESKGTLDLNSLQTVKKPKGEDTKGILEAHANNGQVMEQWVRIEQFTDTSYIFAIALSALPQQATYTAGNALLFLDIADRRLLIAKCVVDCFPIAHMEVGSVPDIETLIHGGDGLPTTSGDLQFRTNQRNGATPQCWLAPCFEVSKKGIETLFAKGRNLFRVAIEIPDADGFWFLYPTEGWETELRNIISRIQ